MHQLPRLERVDELLPGRLTDLVKQPPERNGIDDTSESTPADHNAHCRTPFPQEPMPTDGGRWRVEERARNAEEQMGEHELVILLAKSDRH